MGTMERFERFKAGEDVEKLMGEAEVAETARAINPKTRRAAPVTKNQKATEEAEA